MVEQFNHDGGRSRNVADLLRCARESKGLSIKQVSEYLNISAQVIEEIESGAVINYLQQVYGLLSIYAESVHSIFDGFFNLNSSFSSGDKNSNEIVTHVLDCIAFHKMLHGKPLHLTAIPKARGKMAGHSTNLSGRTSSLIRKAKISSLTILELRAQEVIKKFQLYRLPINVYQIAEGLGINVVFESFPSDFYMKLKAFCYKEDSFGLIGINRSHPTVLQRYSLAHELHHFLYDFENSQFLCGPENENEVIEIDAERFAAELLMPRPMVERLISNPLNISYLTIHLVARHFGVSYEAAAIRLAKFGLVKSSKDVCDRIYRKRDRQKTEFLLANKIKYLKAVFGLETGITELQEFGNSVRQHSLCGATIVDASHTVCWQCGLELNPLSTQMSYLKNPYRQHPANLLPDKVTSLRQSQDRAFNQLSLNLNVN